MKQFTTTQLAKELNITRATLQRWVRVGAVKAPPMSEIGPLQVRLWSEQDIARVRDWMKDNYRPQGGRQKRT